ncbi:unnamed protein product [Notodromas monacha]|uniref:Major facilitator superfamily (MFS) profile domain-containing protein n=1 Tax=Notodromas monacha TaxID=399045 RepID=A0A7R9BDH3_9CRUS|nr:unnamed protein product [Notodromas monacha]CAG0912241.1 unnamed protein product [Notodromas monacha]
MENIGDEKQKTPEGHLELTAEILRAEILREEKPVEMGLLTSSSSGEHLKDEDERNLDRALSSPVPGQKDYRLYRMRFVTLAIFCMFSMSNAFQWIEFVIIENIVAEYYGVSHFAVEWTSMIYMVSYIPLIFPGAWFLEKYGLRIAMIIGAAGTAAGSWLKLLGTDPSSFIWAFAGQTLVAWSQVFVLGIPPHLAAHWFGPQELSTATAVGVFGNQLGIALGFLVPPMMIPVDGDVETKKRAFTKLFLTGAVFTAVIFVLIMALVKDSAPTPPSAARDRQLLSAREDSHQGSGKKFLQSVFHLLFKHKGYKLLFLTYGINVGVFYAISTLLNKMLVAHYEDVEKHAGVIGLSFVVSGMVGSVVCGVIMDKTHKYKETTLTVYCLSLISFGLYTFALPFGSLPFVYVGAIIVGFFMTGYLSVGFELAAEITYPEAEGTTSGLLNASAQIFGLVVTSASSFAMDTIGTVYTLLVLAGLLFVGCIGTYLIPNDLRRSLGEVGGQELQKKAGEEEIA